MEIGPFVKCPHPEMIEAIGIAGFDFAVVDMEHTPLGPRDLYPLVLAAERRRLKLIVRIPENRPEYIKWCKDLGINVIQVPNVWRTDDAILAVRAARFEKGDRGLCRFVRAANYSEMRRDIYIETADLRNVCILQIESLRALDHLGAILMVLDPTQAMIFFGPYDLSASMGKPGAIMDPQVTGAIEAGIRQCKNVGFKVGTFASDAEEVRFWAERGVDMIEYASDLAIFMAGSKALLDVKSTWTFRT